MNTPRQTQIGELLDKTYSLSNYSEEEMEEAPEYFDKELKGRPDLTELRDYIRATLTHADYFNWRGGDEIESFVEGFTLAAIILSNEAELTQVDETL